MCAAKLSELERELSEAAARFVRDPDTDFAPWFTDWDRRWLELSGGCGPLEPTRQDLKQLRADIEAILTRYRGHQAPMQRRVRKALAAY